MMGEQYDGPDVCATCEGYGEVCVGFGIWSQMRPGLARCPDCDGTGQRDMMMEMAEQAMTTAREVVLSEPYEEQNQTPGGPNGHDV